MRFGVLNIAANLQYLLLYLYIRPIDKTYQAFSNLPLRDLYRFKHFMLVGKVDFTFDSRKATNVNGN